jgi:branched-chain amino acid transport system ATP-binding protein
VSDGGVRFGGVAALDGVSLGLSGGELLGVVGPNGAGKTTLLKAVAGIVSLDFGTIELQGKMLEGLPTHKRIWLGLGVSQQLVRPFRRLTTLDNVALAAGHYKTRSPWRALIHTNRQRERQQAQRLLQTVGISSVANNLPDQLPLGHLKRLEVARALALAPKLLLLDEPLAGLNQIEARALADTLRKLNDAGLSMLLVEHNLAEVMRICDRLVVLDNGRVLAEGPPRAVMEQSRVRSAYLGVSPDA